MGRAMSVWLGLILLSGSLAGCLSQPNDEVSSTEDTNQDNSTTTSSSAYDVVCPDGTNETIRWGRITCATPSVFWASDVPEEQVNLTLDWYNVAVAEWGNYGPVELFIVGNDHDAAVALEDVYCERHIALDSNWDEEYDCANENFQIFTHYVEEGGAAIATQKRADLDYDFMMMIMSSRSPGPASPDYKIMALHEYFHIFQLSHTSDDCETDGSVCLRDVQLGGAQNPWFVEGGAEFMAQKLYSTQEGVGENHLANAMRDKLDRSLEWYTSQNTSLDQLTYADHGVYDIGSWFIAYLVANEGEEAFVNGFHDDVDELGFDGAFEANFNATRSEYLAEFETFIHQPIDDIMSLFPPPSTADERHPLAQECLGGHDNLQEHYHAIVKVSVMGEEVSIPDDVGLNDEGCSMRQLHTHDGTGKVHLEFTRQGVQAPLEAFFDVWGKHMDNTGFDIHRVNESTEFLMFLSTYSYDENGRLVVDHNERVQVDTFNDHILEDRQYIELVFQNR